MKPTGAMVSVIQATRPAALTLRRSTTAAESKVERR